MFNFFEGFWDGAFFPFRSSSTDVDKDISYWAGFFSGLDDD